MRCSALRLGCEEALASWRSSDSPMAPPYGAPNKVVASWEWRSIPSTSVARCYVAGAADAAGIVWLMGGGSTLWQGALTYDSTEFLRPYTGSVEWGYGVSDDDDDDDEGGSSGGGEGGGQAEGLAEGPQDDGAAVWSRGRVRLRSWRRDLQHRRLRRRYVE